VCELQLLPRLALLYPGPLNARIQLLPDVSSVTTTA
jgi:hypothetical protein